jgi:hypothetical protein
MCIKTKYTSIVEMSNQYTIPYSPNDFFYVNAQKNNTMPSDSDCADLNINDPAWTSKCNGDNFKDNNKDCINQALCQNKASATLLSTSQNINNGADGKFLDSNSMFGKTILNTFNLSAGIIVLIYLIYKNRVATI